MRHQIPQVLPEAEHLGGCCAILLSSGRRVLAASEPLSGRCLFCRPQSCLLVGFLLEGGLTFKVDGRSKFVLEPGRFAIYRSQTPFGQWRLHAERARFLIVEGEPHAASVCPLGTGDRDVPACLCCPNYRQPSRTLMGPLPIEHIPEVTELARFRPHSFGSHLQMEARLLHVIGHLLTDTPPVVPVQSGEGCPLWLTTEDRHRLDDLARYLRENAGQAHSLAGLGRMLCLNEFKLKVGFKQVFGETVFRYLRRVRMEKARALIREGNATITEIALEVGYSNPSQFSAAFSAHWGIKPKQYQLCCRLRGPSPSSVSGEQL